MAEMQLAVTVSGLYLAQLWYLALFFSKNKCSTKCTVDSWTETSYDWQANRNEKEIIGGL